MQEICRFFLKANPPITWKFAHILKTPGSFEKSSQQKRKLLPTNLRKNIKSMFLQLGFSKEEISSKKKDSTRNGQGGWHDFVLDRSFEFMEKTASKEEDSTNWPHSKCSFLGSKCKKFDEICTFFLKANTPITWKFAHITKAPGKNSRQKGKFYQKSKKKLQITVDFELSFSKEETSSEKTDSSRNKGTLN